LDSLFLFCLVVGAPAPSPTAFLNTNSLRPEAADLVLGAQESPPAALPTPTTKTNCALS